MRRTGPRFSLGNEVTSIGITVVLVVTIAVFLAYNANNGLPFLPAYRVSVDVPDAAQLVRGDDVRVGGARVGQVSEVTAIEPRPGRPPAARLKLALDPELAPLPADSRAQVRPVSILGGKYLALEEGRSRRGIVAGGVLPVQRARTVVDLDEALQVFDRETTRGLQGALGGLGEGFAGRGTELNSTLISVRRLLPPLQRVMGVLVAPETDLDGFIRAAAQTTGALAPVAGALGGFVDNGAVTLAALEASGPALGQTIEELPPTEITTTRVLSRLTPLVTDSAALARELRPAVRLLPGTSAGLTSSLRSGTKTLRARTRGQLDPLTASFAAVARDPASRGSISKTEEVLSDLQPTLETTATAQLSCNVLPLWARNLASIASEGDAGGSWINLSPINHLAQMTQAGQPDAQLHLNFYPRQDATECEAGNEPYSPGRLIGNPPGVQGR